MIETDVYIGGHADISLMASVDHLLKRIAVTETGVFLTDLRVVVAVAHIAASHHIDVFNMGAGQLPGKTVGIEVAENSLHTRRGVKIEMQGAPELGSYGFDRNFRLRYYNFL